MGKSKFLKQARPFARVARPTRNAQVSVCVRAASRQRNDMIEAYLLFGKLPTTQIASCVIPCDYRGTINGFYLWRVFNSSYSPHRVICKSSSSRRSFEAGQNLGLIPLIFLLATLYVFGVVAVVITKCGLSAFNFLFWCSNASTFCVTSLALDRVFLGVSTSGGKTKLLQRLNVAAESAFFYPTFQREVVKTPSQFSNHPCVVAEDSILFNFTRPASPIPVRFPWQVVSVPSPCHLKFTDESNAPTNATLPNCWCYDLLSQGVNLCNRFTNWLGSFDVSRIVRAVCILPQEVG